MGAGAEGGGAALGLLGYLGRQLSSGGAGAEIALSLGWKWRGPGPGLYGRVKDPETGRRGCGARGTAQALLPCLQPWALFLHGAGALLLSQPRGSAISSLKPPSLGGGGASSWPPGAPGGGRGE